MNYGNYFTRKQCKKNAYIQNKKDFMLAGTYCRTLSRMSVFTDFFVNTIFFIYVPGTLWDFSYFIL